MIFTACLPLFWDSLWVSFSPSPDHDEDGPVFLFSFFFFLRRERDEITGAEGREKDTGAWGRAFGVRLSRISAAAPAEVGGTRRARLITMIN